MSQVQIAWLEFILVGGLGVILTLSGMMIHIVAQRTNQISGLPAYVEPNVYEDEKGYVL